MLEERIRQYAKEHGYNLVKVFRKRDQQRGGRRPELEKLIRGLSRRLAGGGHGRPGYDRGGAGEVEPSMEGRLE